MKPHPPSDHVEIISEPTTPNRRLDPQIRRLLCLMRRTAGAIDLRIRIDARPAGTGPWRKLRHVTKVYRVHSAMNAEQLITGGPIAGRHFTATTDILDFYERHELGESKPTT